MQDYKLNATLGNRSVPIRNITLHPGEVTNRGLREGCDLRVVKPGGEGWEFLVDDEPLPLSNEGVWLWSPGFYAGLVHAVLRKNGAHLASYRLNVSPDPGKLALSLYQTMLEELIQFGPALAIGTEPASYRLGTLGSDRNDWMEFRRLRLHASAFFSALQQLSRRPIRTVRSSRRMAPLRAARHVDLQTVRSAAINGTLAPLVMDRDAFAMTQTAPDPAYDLPWFEEHLDGPANRCITAMVLAVRRRAVSLIARLDQEVYSTDDSETRTSLRVRWAVRRRFLEKVIHHLRQFMLSEPFRSVSNPEITAAGLNAISSDPAYSRAYRCGWHAIRSGLRGMNATEAVWLCPTWELYERWCFGRIVKQLQIVTGRPGTIDWTASQGVWKCQTSSGICIEGLCQRVFSSVQTAEFHSVSRERRPDIVITAEFQGQRRYVVLDAKYMQTRSSILPAMASAHIYKDSLRWNGDRPSKALLLVPAGGGAPWLEADGFIASEDVGVLVLSPEQDGDQLSCRLHELLDF